MTRVPRSIYLVALVGLMPACSTDSFERVKKDVAHAAVALESERDADSLAAAALVSGSFMFGKDPKRALSLIARATAAAPDRADLAWLQAAICQQAPPCDANPFEIRFRILDPSNGAGWLGELDRAWTAKDTERTNEALRAIGQTDRVDLYYTTLIGKLTPKIAEAGSIALDEATIAVTGALAGETVSSYPSASHACKGERLMQADVTKLCQGVARVTSEVKALVRRVAEREGINESALVKQFLEILVRTQAVAALPAPAGPDKVNRGARLYVRLAAEDWGLLKARSGARGLPSATYVSLLVRSHLRGAAPLPKAEYLALKQSVLELTAMGRNLNQIARAMNQGARPGLPGRAEVGAMLKIAEALRDHFKGLLKANALSWSGHEKSH